MQLRTYLLLAGLLTGITMDAAWADDEQRGCPPPPEGGPPKFEHDAAGPPPFDRRGHGHHFRVHVALAEFDLDKDGRVSREEVDRALKARFEEADTDHDGRLDAEEFAHARLMAPPPFGGPHEFHGRMRWHGAHCPPPEGDGPRAEMRGGPRPGDRHPPFDPKVAFNHFDWNLDGELSFEEFAAPIRQMALHLDRNGDGVIDADEMKGPAMIFGPGFGPPPGPPPEPPRDR
ncbi:MAG: hypothetical protein GC190_21230 [Alphaproteobacteria bacterium]|nr:hypothetical protein [Alphaproteobacteria bacterium]